MNISIKLDDPRAMPIRAHATDAGADLFSNKDITIYPGELALIDTGVSIKLFTGLVGLVYNRSSQGKIQVTIPHSVGVIDADYRGNIKVLLKNNGEDPYFIYHYATKIAQLVLTPVWMPDFQIWTEDLGEWDDTVRGINGFGSTGT